MIALTYQITLLEPALITMLDGEPNSKVSLNYLPGSVLRGALIRAYTGGGRIEITSTDEVAQRLFFSIKTRFLNGYPIPKDGTKERSLPTPLSWHIEKGQEGPIYDFAHEDYAEDTPDDTKQWKTTGKPFRSRIYDDEASNRIRQLSPDRQLAVHTTRSRIRGRSTSDDGAVFRYDALAPRQVFEAVALCEDEADADRIQSLLIQISMVGGSRNAGYGRVSVTVGARKPEAKWREFDLEKPAVTDMRLILTLLSDALLRDTGGQMAVSPAIMEKALQSHLPGAKIVLDSSSTQRLAFMREEIIGGFNRKWGLPLPQTHAFAMGSIFIVNVPVMDTAQVEELERTGIGERRNEGFGRVGVSICVYDQWKQIEQEKGAPQVLDDYDLQSSLLSQGKFVAQQMVNRLLTKRLERQLLTSAAARSIETSNEVPLNRSQISRLRSQLRTELQKNVANMTASAVTDFLEDLRPTARMQYEKAKVRTGGSEEQLLSWLKDVCSKTPQTFMAQTLGFGANMMPNIGGVTPSNCVEGQLNTEYVTEYKLRFLDAVLARAAKESK